jgi:hypothetical protein
VADDRAALRRSTSVYQGGVSLVNADGTAMLDYGPPLQSYHPDYYDGTTAVNEAGQVLGKVHIELGDRFFYTGYPEVRRQLNRIDPKDVTDANGDGKVTLAMYAAERQRKLDAQGNDVFTEAGEKMLDLEVTRIREDGLMIFTKQHPREYLDALNVPHPGWPYHQTRVVNERGDKSWIVNMPGDTYSLVVPGRKLTLADLPDANGDGRRAITFHDFGPGDEVTVPAYVYLDRTAPDSYTVRANAAVELTLPGSAATWSKDGQNWPPFGRSSRGNRVQVKLTEADLAGGTVQVRVRK